MITTVLIFLGLVVFLLNHFKVISNPLIIFLVIALIIISSAFLLPGKVSCPFTSKCPFTFCPLHIAK